MKQKTRFVCQQCGSVAPKWMGRCPECGNWNCIVEEVMQRSTTSSISIDLKKPCLINEITYFEEERILTSIKELDRVLGGGIVPGSLILVGGDPGIGKSTLMLQACGNLSKSRKTLYISGEESEKQIKLRAKRLDIEDGLLYISTQNDISLIEESVKNMAPEIVVIDSIQTVYSPNLESGPGSVSQIRNHR